MTAVRLRSDVMIGPLLPKYAPSMFGWMCDPEVADNLGLQRQPSLEYTERWINNATRDHSMRVFAILLDGQHCGNIVIDCIVPYSGTGRLSAYVGEASARGRGVGTTAAYLVIKNYFVDPSHQRLYLTVHARNLKAINAYAKMGFIVHNVLKGEVVLHGEHIDVAYMGLAREDFERVQVERDA
jgi:RimJ/RimL family protein N-acetyltransferase